MGQITIYAELNKKQYAKVYGGEYGLEVPYGVEMTHKAGSRSLNFHCSRSDVAREMIDALEADGISYSIIDGEELLRDNT